MSTQIKLHERTDVMTDEMLTCEGIIGGPMAQLISSKSYFDELLDATSNADSYIVGNSNDDGPSDISDLFNGVVEVTERKTKQVSATVANAEDLSPSLVEWLEAHEGDEVFVIHW